jgi:hypothetical protein
MSEDSTILSRSSVALIELSEVVFELGAAARDALTHLARINDTLSEIISDDEDTEDLDNDDLHVGLLLDRLTGECGDLSTVAHKLCDLASRGDIAHVASTVTDDTGEYKPMDRAELATVEIRDILDKIITSSIAEIKSRSDRARETVVRSSRVTGELDNSSFTYVISDLQGILKYAQTVITAVEVFSEKFKDAMAYSAE